jgi:hypothetical protein
MKRRRPHRFTSPWRPPRPARWPSAPATHWLDKHEAEREKLDEELRNRIECSPTGQDGEEARR